jgi:hypothetical protein
MEKVEIKETTEKEEEGGREGKIRRKGKKRR